MYSREIDGRVLTLGASGWTYDNTFVLWDKETGSLWFPQSDGLLSIGGPQAGKLLQKRTLSDTNWKAWKKAHPKSRILDGR